MLHGGKSHTTTNVVFFGKRQCKPISTLLMIRGDVFFKFTDIYGYIYTLLCNFLGKPCHERRELHTILLVLVDCILYIYTKFVYHDIPFCLNINNICWPPVNVHSTQEGKAVFGACPAVSLSAVPGTFQAQSLRVT